MTEQFSASGAISAKLAKALRNEQARRKKAGMLAHECSLMNLVREALEAKYLEGGK